MSKKDKLYIQTLEQKIKHMEEDRDRILKEWKQEQVSRDYIIEKLRASNKAIFNAGPWPFPPDNSSEKSRQKLVSLEIENGYQKEQLDNAGLPYVGKCPPMPPSKRPIQKPI